MDKTCYKTETNSGEIRSFHDQETRGTQPKSEPSAVKLSCPHHLSCTVSRTKKNIETKNSRFFVLNIQNG